MTHTRRLRTRNITTSLHTRSTIIFFFLQFIWINFNSVLRDRKYNIDAINKKLPEKKKELRG